MFRNQEWRLYMVGLVGIALCTVIAISFLSFLGATIVAVAMILIIGISIGFTRFRYKEFEKLSSYLRQISSGAFSLDVRDNQEGELSILKNEIYKVTQMLSEQSSRLTNDKTKLTEALSDISHQLKTPLTSMTVMADLLANPKLPSEKREEFTQSIVMQLERIDWLVSSLLKLSKIDAGTVDFKRDQVHVVEMVKAAGAPLLIPMELKNQTFLIDGKSDVVFQGDFHWTKEALINLIKNATEHTDEGGVISISFSQNVIYTEIKIQDNGSGINKNELPHIFKRFFKGERSGANSIGIGLAMAHRIVTSQNGAIEVKSRLNEGTTFTLKFYRDNRSK
ncbi:sensor histidine kinase [Shouchella patagoniensis]|uniref:sensor histidine kinase n=1 Tax=Shouchella patagoniensis TaxID=228576 RepID=UPI000994C0F7|nr:HAMP domain-containing sensor histidine kinase [Shouchella patagoniensis]